MTVVRPDTMRSPGSATDDRVVLVTGGASGLGAATADVLAGAGFRVVVADLQAEAAERTAERLAERGDAALGLRLDVRDPASAAEAVGRVAEELGALDVLINNAGTDLTLPFDEIPAEAFDRVIDVNLRGPAVMLRAALPALRRSNRPQVVNISSTAAFRGWPNASAYHASKWGLRGLGQGLFTELREDGIRLTTVFAGGMQTPFILERFPETPLDVLQDPRNVAETIRFVLSLPPESVIPEITVLPVRETSWP
jgi:NAD(P)-dependent dehydrogenase (short-subunit alcohol dehydrogenase family)